MESIRPLVNKTLGNKNSPIFESEEYNFFATKKTGPGFFKDTLGPMKLNPCRMPPIKRLFQAKTILSNNEGNDIFDFSQFQIQNFKKIAWRQSRKEVGQKLLRKR